MSSLEQQTPLRKLRLARGLSLEEVARGAGTDTGTLSRIETGVRSATPTRAEKLVKFYGSAISEMHILYPRRFPAWHPSVTE